MSMTRPDRDFPDYIVPRRHQAEVDTTVFVSNRRSGARGDQLPSWAYLPRPTAADIARREQAVQKLLG